MISGIDPVVVPTQAHFDHIASRNTNPRGSLKAGITNIEAA
jgi:hypothetical protein